ncbi:MAG: cell surface protein SprA, partial [Candidatus Eisenbacteria bacterium]
QPGPADQLNIDYSYAPLFQQAGRTLIGSAFRLEGTDKSFGGAFMYESQGAQDIRPRIGEEPSRSVIGDLNTAWGFHPDWITRMVDRLPGIRTTAPSDFNVQAEVGASFPNPNTKNVIYIDDMDGVRDEVALSMSAERWLRTSPPRRKDGVGNSATNERSILADTVRAGQAGQRNAEIDWFTPISAVKEGDLKPNLTNAEGAQTTHTALALSLPRRPRNADPADTLWAGLTYPLDRQGLDLSRSQFIEVWVNDFRDSTERANSANRFMKLHIDLGWVSEDQMRSPDVPPNGKLDTEDRTPEGGTGPDGQLDVTGARTEDTGYDQLTDAEEIAAGIPIRDLTTANAQDPEGDDYHLVSDNIPHDDINPDDFRGSNGTEGNQTLNPNPDTEDLNLSTILDVDERNFDYTIGLCDTCRNYLVTDVRRDFPGASVGNGWRRYRIPIADSLRTQFGAADISVARQVRVWLEGVLETDAPKRPLLMLGGLEIVGSRWLATALTDSEKTAGTTLTLNALNTVDNADEYRAPFDPGSDRAGGQAVARREQALAVEFENLLPGDTLEVFKTFSIDEDYSRYGKLDWFVRRLKITDFTPGTTPLYYFVRFASDELGRNYYEYKARVPERAGLIDWSEVKLELTALSNLKLAPNFPVNDPILYQVPGPHGDDVLTVSGRPSLTRLRRVSFGIINEQDAGGTTIHSGKLLLDELRGTDIAKDAGYAERLQVGGRLSNLANYNFSWNGRDANFQSVGESRGSGNSQSQITAGTNVDLHRFFEGTGILLPVGINYARNSSKPRFTAGDDVIRTGALEAASETRSEMRSFTTSYSRMWSQRSNALLRYTLGGITANYSRNQSDATSPTSVVSVRGQAANVSYGITPRNFIALRMPLTKARFYPLPERFYWNYAVATSEQLAYDRLRDASGLVLRNDLTGRTASINFGADTRPFESFHHHFEAIRNLTLPEGQREQVGFINLGRVVSWRQNMDAHYSPNRGAWLSPTFGWSGSYAQDNRPELSQDLSIRALANGQSLTASWLLPFDRLQPHAQRGAPADTGRAARHSTRDPVRGLLYRLGAISAEASYNQSSSYSRLLGTSEFLYLVGLSDNPGLKPDGTGKMRDTTGNTIGKGQDWRAAVRTRFAMPSDVMISFRGEYTWRRTEQNL